MWTARIVLVVLTFFFLSSVDAANYNPIADCFKLVSVQNADKKKPSIPPNACHDTDASLCFALFPLDANTIQNNLME
ncbi:unnamed protein product [Dracunculus medinensis]|uniref:Secreted protein n=1 Tax=Dracunculus medinensis TaxID=318479 RepID=A0A0N4URF8_DRAME|nr:unnamed protein product [Dracunculus medinensis]